MAGLLSGIISAVSSVASNPLKLVDTVFDTNPTKKAAVKAGGGESGFKNAFKDAGFPKNKGDAPHPSLSPTAHQNLYQSRLNQPSHKDDDFETSPDVIASIAIASGIVEGKFMGATAELDEVQNVEFDMDLYASAASQMAAASSIIELVLGELVAGETPPQELPSNGIELGR